MLEMLYEWIRNLSFYIVIAAAILEALPGEGYKKYVRFFSGLITILLLFTPVLKVFGMEPQFSEFYHNWEYELEKQELERQAEYFESIDLTDFVTRTDSGIYGEQTNMIEVEDIRIGEEVEGVSGSD